MNTARQRLRKILKDEPFPCAKWNLAELAAQAGVSRQRVSQIVGPYQKVAPTERLLASFLAAHPEAMLTRARGGMSFAGIGAVLGVGADSVGRAWRRLDLPNRALQGRTKAQISHDWYARNRERQQDAAKAWKLANPEKAREVNHAASLRWRSKVLRMERCVACGNSFSWTNGRDCAQRNKGCRTVCSVRCGKRAAKLSSVAD